MLTALIGPLIISSVHSLHPLSQVLHCLHSWWLEPIVDSHRSRGYSLDRLCIHHRETVTLHAQNHWLTPHACLWSMGGPYLTHAIRPVTLNSCLMFYAKDFGYLADNFKVVARQHDVVTMSNTDKNLQRPKMYIWLLSAGSSRRSWGTNKHIVGDFVYHSMK